MLSTPPTHLTTPQECLQEYERRTNTQCFAAVAPLIADDAVYWFGEGSCPRQDAIRQAFERTWAYLHDERYTIYTVHWQGVTLSGPAQGSGRATTIFRKRDDHWQLLVEHLSA